MRLFTKTCARHLLISSFALGLTLLPGLNTTTNVSGQRRHIAPRGNPDIPKIIAELVAVRNSERENRVIDHDREGSMELKKREGYF